MLPSLQLTFDALESRRRDLLADLGAFAPEQLAFHPAPSAWSLADVAQHLQLVDGRTTRVLTDRRVTGVARRTFLDAIYRAPALGLYLRTGIVRAKMPVKGVAPDPAVTLGETAAKWETGRAALAAHLDTIEDARVNAIVYRHPFGGYMDIFATLDFLVRHHDHHLRQVGRIRGAREFPATPRVGGGIA